MKRKLARLIDHTLLRPTATKRDIATLCREAVRNGFASVCVNSCWVSECARLLKGSKVRVCSVIGFPLGCSSAEAVEAEALAAQGDGADEFDFVLNVGRFKSHDYEMFCEFALVIQTLKTNRRTAVTKLILECCNLTDAEKTEACACARLAGFDFVKTSTGFASGGATVEDVALLRKAAGPRMGVKAAGGIRSRADALALVAAGATRLGASCGVELVKGE